MFHPQQNSYTNYSYPQAPNPNPNANPNANLNYNILYPQPVLPSELPSEPALHPPGIDLYATSSSYPQIPAGFESQTANCEDPNAVSQSWVVKQADPVRYTTAVSSSNEESIVSTSLNSLWNNYLMNQYVANGVTNTVPKQTKVIQPMRCDICNIDCNSKDVFQKHLLGKKHKKKLQIHNNSATTILGASSVVTGEVLETKKQELTVGGAEVDSGKFCTICNVACNSQVVFDNHLAGKKHAAQAGIRPPNEIANPNSVFSISPTVQPQGNCTREGGPKQTKDFQFAWCEVCDIYCNSNDILIKHKLGKKHQKNVKGLEKFKSDTGAPASIDAPVTKNPIIGPMENPGTENGKSMVEPQGSFLFVGGPKQVKAAQSAWCEVCNIYCNNNEVLILHQSGQKHQKKLKALEKPKMNTSASASTDAPVLTNPIIGPMENPETGKHKSTSLKRRKASRSQAPEEDLDTKKRKIMEGGVAANAVRTCTICNVVCNSQAVFKSHLTGSKHAAMLKKQAVAALTSAGPEVAATT